jgi:transcriptional regulator with XRE-family HTH domain
VQKSEANLAKTIRNIRQDLKQTMVQFAESLGTEQSTVSRYEAGQLVPSKTILILLYVLASGENREAILEALGASGPAIENRYRSAEETLKKLPRNADLTVLDFAEESAALVQSGEVDPALVNLVKLWRGSAGNRRLRRVVAGMLPYFEFIANQGK